MDWLLIFYFLPSFAFLIAVLYIHSIVYSNALQLVKRKESTIDSSMSALYYAILFVLLAIFLISQTKMYKKMIHKIIACLYVLLLGGSFYTMYYLGNKVIQEDIAKGGSYASRYNSMEWNVILGIAITMVISALIAILPLLITSFPGFQQTLGSFLLKIMTGDIFFGSFLVFLFPIGFLPLVWYLTGMNINRGLFNIGLGIFSGLFLTGSFLGLAQLFID